jgi:hypothetical protein
VQIWGKRERRGEGRAREEKGEGQCEREGGREMYNVGVERREGRREKGEGRRERRGEKGEKGEKEGRKGRKGRRERREYPSRIQNYSTNIITSRRTLLMGNGLSHRQANPHRRSLDRGVISYFSKK